MPDQRNSHVRPDIAPGACRRAHRMALAAACTLTICTVACGSDSKPSSAPSIAETPAPVATEAPTTTTTTEAVITTAPATTTTKPVATTTAAPRTVTGKGTLVSIPEALLPGPPAADGWVTVTGAAAWDGDLVGKETYTEAFSPADAAGVIIARADAMFTGTLAGVGDGSFSWREAEHPTTDHDSGTQPLVGISGVFEGATGTLRWTSIDDDHAAYEVDFVWA